LKVGADGTIYVADARQIKEIDTSGLVTIRGRFSEGFAVDKEGVFFGADFSIIARMGTDGVSTVIAGGGQSSPLDPTWDVDSIGSAARLSGNKALEVDPNGNIFVVSLNNTLRKVTPTRVVTTLAGIAGSTDEIADGLGSEARFDWPTDIALGKDGVIFVLDRRRTIRECRRAAPPSIIAQPTSVACASGHNAMLRVTIGGNPEPSLQWYKDSVPLEGATSATLVLTNVQSADAGLYSVAISNVIDRVTSESIILQVSPVLVACERVQAGLRLSVFGAPNTAHIIEASTDLRTWTEATGITTDATGVAHLEIRPSNLENASFYRATPRS
jgi:hypothetical protein